VAAARAPAVSIGMPAYNSEAWIASAIESMLNQSFGDFELIISDNASTDATYSLCERYARVDARVRLYRNPQNVGANRNYLAVLKRARAPYFKWASSNDVCAPTFIEKCVRALERDASAVLAFARTALFESDISHAQLYERDLELMADAGSERYIELCQTMGLNNSFNAVIRLDALRSAGPLGNFQGADIVLMAELAMMGKFLVIPEVLFFRRMSREAATKLKAAREVDQHIEPDIRRPLKWQYWRFYFALLRAYARQQSLTLDSLRTFFYILKQLRWSSHVLASDVRHALTRTRW
jgi:glycosyltransferase involved in cell wall biosynthesis